MVDLGVNIAIIQSGEILLTKREDFEVWCLPGGAVDKGESIAQAAIREAYEETGLEVELTRLVGIYSRPGWPDAGAHIISFTARPIGGELKPDPHEVIEMGYFGPDKLPQDMLWWHKQRILDALNGIGGGVVWSQEIDWPFENNLSREELYARRDRSGLSRRDFFFDTLGKPGESREILEVGSAKNKKGAD
jgi:ADP-ribose pyrophosphatase YjhB (NUDIX family)